MNTGFKHLMKSIMTGMVIITVSTILLSCTSIPYNPDDYKEKKIALIFTGSEFISEVPSIVFFPSTAKELQKRLDGILNVALKDEELYRHFKRVALAQFSKAKIPGFTFGNSDIYARYELLLPNNEVDYKMLAGKGYTHVLYMKFTYNINYYNTFLGFHSNIYDINEIQKTFYDYTSICWIRSDLMPPNNIVRYTCASVKYLKENAADEDEDENYYSVEDIMRGDNSMLFQVSKASISFYLTHVIKRIQTGVLINEEKILKPYRYHDFINKYGNI